MVASITRSPEEMAVRDKLAKDKIKSLKEGPESTFGDPGDPM